jgi:hypothetical protein
MNGKLLIALGAALVIVLLAFQTHRDVLAPKPSEPADLRLAKGLARPRLPAPRLHATQATGESVEERRSTNLLTRVLRGEEPPKLTPEQIGPYLEANRRSVESLLAASRTTGDKAFLQEAKEKYPNDPRVAFDAVWRWSGSPEERRQWLDTFKQSAPDNALPNYLSALDHFKSGQTDQAVQDLSAAAGKSQFQDYSLDFVQNAEEAYRSAGYPEAEAKTVAETSLLLPHLAPLKELGRNMSELADSYRQAGDEASAQATMQMVMNLGESLTEPTPGHALITDLVGLAIERRMLTSLDPGGVYGDSGLTVRAQLDQLDQRRNDLKALARSGEQFFEMMPDTDLISYLDRRKMFGEVAAMRWAADKYGTK